MKFENKSSVIDMYKNILALLLGILSCIFSIYFDVIGLLIGISNLFLLKIITNNHIIKKYSIYISILGIVLSLFSMLIDFAIKNSLRT